VGPQEKQGIWVISVIGATLRKLRDDAHEAAISDDGSHIVFLDSNTKELWLMSADGSQARAFLKPEPGEYLSYPRWFPSDRRVLYVKYRDENGQARVTLESRDLNGSDPVVLLSNPNLKSMSWAEPGRLIFSAEESPTNHDSNLWELWYDVDSGKPKGAIRRLTDWQGFRFAEVRTTADAKRLVFLNLHDQSDVYLGELTNSGVEMKPPQRVTLDDRYDWPTAWSSDSKNIFFYSDLGGTFDIYRQDVNQHNPDILTSGPDDKWAPQLSPDGKWILYMSWPKPPAGAADLPPGKLMRVPISGGPAEFVMDIKGHPSPGFIVGSFPSFRCPMHPGADCVLSEKGDKQLAFTAFDPVQGRKTGLTKFSGDPDYLTWDLSPDGSRVAICTFDFKAGDIAIVPLKPGDAQKFSVMPWNELVAIAWTANGKGLFLASSSSRGTSVVTLTLGSPAKLLWKTVWDVYQLTPSPDGRYLALGPDITDANSWIADLPAK
jgi:Tol biopolymer transport system component